MTFDWAGFAVGAGVGVLTSTGIILLAYHVSKPAIARTISTEIVGRLSQQSGLNNLLNAVNIPPAALTEIVTIGLERSLPL